MSQVLQYRFELFGPRKGQTININGHQFISGVCQENVATEAGAILIKKGTVALGDMLHIKGHTTDLKQKVTSLQIDRAPVEKAGKGDEIGLLVKKRVRINDKVYKVKI